MEKSALSGVRVIELASMGPVPFCGMLLADMGADVLRIDRVDGNRDGIEMDQRFDLRGRNKRSVRIDLKRDEGRMALLKLVRGADIIMEGYRPGVAEKLGIGPADTSKVNPALVYGRATGWGQDGPMSRTVGHDINYIALTGALDMIGPGGQPPVPPLNLVGDYGGGALYLAFGLLAALIEARSSGKGQVVDMAMIDGVNSLLAVFHGFRQAGQLLPGRGVNVLDGGAPYYSTYETKDGGYMAVGAIEPRFYGELLRRLGIEEPAATQNDRERWPHLRALFAERFATRTRDEWQAIFEGSDACVSPVLSLAEAGSFHHNEARSMMVDLEGLSRPAPAPRLSRTPGRLRHGPPRSGQHTIEALRDWGFTDEEIGGGISAGALGT